MFITNGVVSYRIPDVDYYSEEFARVRHWFPEFISYGSYCNLRRGPMTSALKVKGFSILTEAPIQNVLTA